jgi:predicted cobalt transporter CbtA
MASAAASAAPGHTVTATAAHALGTSGRATPSREHQQSLPDTGFDGMAVAAIGTGLTGAGWLLMLVGSRQLRRRIR